jgi:hypothetical protein
MPISSFRIEAANQSTILIDNYIDENILVLLSKRKPHVGASLKDPGKNGSPFQKSTSMHGRSTIKSGNSMERDGVLSCLKGPTGNNTMQPVFLTTLRACLNFIQQ